MEIKLARIDHRLLHGIVASQWAPSVAAMRVMVVDDETANDVMKKESMKLAKPAGCALSIITLETALTNYKNHKYDGQTVFLIAKSPNVIVEFQKSGITIPKLNIGGTEQGRDSAVIFSNRANATDEELEMYRYLMSNGTEVTVQYILADKKIPLGSFIK
ncbi:PTS system mannose/fructose/N-acetylgalactosamine-transporter subunit IIB [Lacrimispora indolis]|uniref:PTS system mannose/fructose/N-acetylgalactosamine-transporter subunit IIB n=1 Tax=Lacrimispora indolis TaxID=69825 RepID=UPI0003FBC832|nr:PTS sugar transporter subunit IIB [[Clostridium] methoxybenzovorans]